ncbi:response regulator [bacterium]|nr:MAG: response regulator [bacterium]
MDNTISRIVIVDDNESERKVLRGLLEDSGFEVVAEGANGAQAIEICKETTPDLVIMDVSMPVKDGITAAGEINRLCHTAVILLTACDDDETIKRAVDAGVMGYLAKPVRHEELLASVKLAISRFGEAEHIKKENRDLKNTLQARKIVERAKGLLMEKEGLSEAEAFSRIRKISMDRRQSMAAIAEIIIHALEEKR